MLRQGVSRWFSLSALVMALRGSILASGVLALFMLSLTPACGLLHFAARSPSDFSRSSAHARSNYRPVKVVQRRTRAAQEGGQIFEVTESAGGRAGYSYDSKLDQRDGFYASGPSASTFLAPLISLLLLPFRCQQQLVQAMCILTSRRTSRASTQVFSKN